MRFHRRILSAVFCAIALFVVCFNIVETVSGAMNMVCWLLPRSTGHDACGRPLPGHHAPITIWPPPITQHPILSTRTAQLTGPSSVEVILDNLSSSAPIQSKISTVDRPAAPVQQPNAKPPLPPFDFGCKPGDNPDPETGICMVIYAAEGDDADRKIASAFDAGHRFFLVRYTDEPLEVVDDTPLALDPAEPFLRVAPETAEIDAAQTLFPDTHLPTLAHLDELLHANLRREAVGLQISRKEGACGGDYVSCGDLHKNCCHKKQPCCGLGCCAEGWHCEDLEKGVCCQDGLTLCGDLCVAGECCPGGFACAKRGETCCGATDGAAPKEDERWRPGHQCCKRGEYCHGGRECRARAGEESGTGKVAAGGALVRAYKRLFG